MLGLMRRHSRSILVKLLYIGLILSFVVWGFSSFENRQALVGVTVNGNEISFQDIENRFENLVDYYKENFKDAFNDELVVTLNLKKQALDSLINRILLIEEADRQNLEATDNEVAARIHGTTSFQKDGRFDNETYLRVLKYYRLTPGDYEAEQRNDILISKVESVVKRTVVVSEDEVLDSYKKGNTKANLEFVKITPLMLKEKVKATDNEIEEYFSANLGNFTIPEKISVAYVPFDPSSYTEEINITDEDYNEYYNNYVDKFTIPGKVKASHILVKFGEDKEANRTKAEELLARVKKGEDFSKIAKEFSDDAASAKKGGDLGFFGRGVMVDSFEEVAFSMEKDEVSDLVESVFGFHIIKISDIVEEKVKPLDDVKEEIRKSLEAELSVEIAEGKAEDLYYEAVKGKSIESLSTEWKLTYKKTDFFPLSSMPVDIMMLRDMVQTASAMEQGWIGRPFKVAEKFYILTLLEKQEPREPTFDEVKKEVKAALLMKKAKQEAYSEGEKMLAKLLKGESLEQLAIKKGFTFDETGTFTQSNNFVPKIGVAQDIVETAFSLTKENAVADTVFKVGADTVLVQLKDRQEIDMETFEKEKDVFSENVLTQKKESVFKKWIEDARGKADIVYHEDLIELQG